MIQFEGSSFNNFPVEKLRPFTIYLNNQFKNTENKHFLKKVVVNGIKIVYGQLECPNLIVKNDEKNIKELDIETSCPFIIYNESNTKPESLFESSFIMKVVKYCKNCDSIILDIDLNNNEDVKKLYDIASNHYIFCKDECFIDKISEDESIGVSKTFTREPSIPVSLSELPEIGIKVRSDDKS